MNTLTPQEMKRRNQLPTPTQPVSVFTGGPKYLNQALGNKPWNQIYYNQLSLARQLGGTIRQADYIISLRPDNNIQVVYQRDALVKRILRK